jgi:tetratricopeptide (TPR) repeat protein
VGSLRPERLVPLLLAAATFLVYSQVGEHDFINFDDGMYVFENPRVQAGLTGEGVRWAFTTTHFSNWHPLTWLSHMLDCELYGLNPAGHHLTSLLLHVANTLLLFIVLRRLTGALWRSAFVAGLFSLHPLHVESVAWVAERKDVLSGFFWMLTLWAYARYTEQPSSRVRYLTVVTGFALGLMAKPMLVTLPFVLLLLDFWPLGRFRGERSGSLFERARIRPLILEKLPLFFLAAASSWVTFVAQRQSGAMVALESLPLDLRIWNALLAYVSYLAKAVWPVGLAVFYAHPGDAIPVHTALAAAFFLVGVSVLVLRAASRRPYLAVGWLWYLGTLVPVIGLIQTGQQAMADRYTYLPLIGVFIMFAWELPELLERWRLRKAWLAPAPVALLCALMVCSWLQVSHWKNSMTLFEHAVRVTSNNAMAHLKLAILLTRQGRDDLAIHHYYETLRISPSRMGAHYNLGVVLAKQGKREEARRHRAIALWIASEMETDSGQYRATGRWGELASNPAPSRDVPEEPEAAAHYHAGMGLARQGRIDEAIVRLRESVRLAPDSVDARLGLGTELMIHGERAGALQEYDEALRLRPDYGPAHYRLALALMMERRVDEAAVRLAKVLRTNPKHRGERKLMRALEENRAQSDY